MRSTPSSLGRFGTRHSTRLAVLFALALGGAACSDVGAPKTPMLRVTNVGTVSLVGLHVGFDGSSTDFGNVAPGATTQYVAISGGVFRYAGYRFLNGDTTACQPAIDFVGESPLAGHRFTYRLSLIADTVGKPRIRLVAIDTDP